MTEDANNGHHQRNKRLSDSPSSQTGNNAAAADDAAKVPEGTPEVLAPEARPTLRFLREHWEILSGFTETPEFLIRTVMLWQTMHTSKSIAMVTLSRELMDDLYGNKTARRIEDAIVNCRLIYDCNGGEFTYQQVNDFLTALENVGLFRASGALDYETATTKEYVGWPTLICLFLLKSPRFIAYLKKPCRVINNLLSTCSVQ